MKIGEMQFSIQEFARVEMELNHIDVVRINNDIYFASPELLAFKRKEADD